MTREIRHAGVPDRPPGDGTWSWDAACAADPDLMFPEYGGDSARAAWVDPRSLCERCPVAAECLKVAMFEEATGAERQGMRGALTPEERADLAAKEAADEEVETEPVVPAQRKRPASAPESKPCAGDCGAQVPWKPGRKPSLPWWCGDGPCRQRANQIASARKRAAQTGRPVEDVTPPASKPCSCGCGRQLRWKRGRRSGGPWWGDAPGCQAARVRLSTERCKKAREQVAA